MVERYGEVKSLGIVLGRYWKDDGRAVLLLAILICLLESCVGAKTEWLLWYISCREMRSSLARGKRGLS